MDATYTSFGDFLRKSFIGRISLAKRRYNANLEFHKLLKEFKEETEELFQNAVKRGDVYIYKPTSNDQDIDSVLNSEADDDETLTLWLKILEKRRELHNRKMRNLAKEVLSDGDDDDDDDVDNDDDEEEEEEEEEKEGGFNILSRFVGHF